ncbi:MAG: hypothetical protein WC343_08980 [Bacilli bacterium]
MKLQDIDRAVALRKNIKQWESELQHISQAPIMELSVYTNSHCSSCLALGIRLTVEHRDVLRALLKVHLEQCIADAVAELESL